MPEVFSSPDDLIKHFIEPGMSIHLAATMSRPNALINALVRIFFQKNPGFTISVTGLHSNANAIALGGIAKKVITGFAGDNYPRPVPNKLYADLLTGDPFELELWSLFALVQRLMAGALKLRGIITNSMAGSDMAYDKLNKSLFILGDPQDKSKRIAILSPLVPDFTFVHGVIGDTEGNIMLTPPSGEGTWGAFAAKNGVIASVEKIVPAGSIPQEFVSIPGTIVRGICEARFGAHPQSLRVSKNIKIDALGDIKTYYDDYDFIVEANKSTARAEERTGWLSKYINLSGGHADYLEVLGKERLRKLTEIREFTKSDNADSNVTESEQLIILTARAIIELVKKNNYKTILAGIGAAHMAAWTAAKILQKEKIPVKVLAELGFYGVSPHQGDIFLFSQLHANNAEALGDITQVLGMLVPGECLGVLGAAELDESGNVNSTKLPNGKFIVGSGGANDIASTADCLIVASAAKSRFVKKVEYVTSPGDRVVGAVSQFGIFKRSGPKNTLQLDSYLDGPGESLSPEDAIDKLTNWDEPGKVPLTEKPISAEELKILRGLDPERIYTG